MLIRRPNTVTVMDFCVYVVKSNLAISGQAIDVVEGDPTSTTMCAQPSVPS